MESEHSGPAGRALQSGGVRLDARDSSNLRKRGRILPASMNQHNRKDPRAKVLSMTVRYRSATLNEFIEHHSYDVSRGGVFITTPSPFPPGTLLKFEVKIADDQRVMQGVGRVVWKRDVSNGKTEPAGMGIKFIKLDDASRAVIERLVASRGDDTVSAYDRSPDAQGGNMFSSFGDPGSSEDPTVIRPRDEVLAVAPSSAPAGEASKTMPAPSGPHLSMGAPASATFSEAPGSLPESSGQTKAVPPEAPSTPAAGASEKAAAPAPPAQKTTSAAPRPVARSVPRNPVNPSEPPADATSRGVLWVTLAALVVGGGFVYMTWIRPKVEGRSPVPVPTTATETPAVAEENPPEDLEPAPEAPAAEADSEPAPLAAPAADSDEPKAQEAPPEAPPATPAPVPAAQPKPRPKPKTTTAPSATEPTPAAPEPSEAPPALEAPKASEPSEGASSPPEPAPAPSAPAPSEEEEFR